jgi:hypothetical protein
MKTLAVLMIALTTTVHAQAYTVTLEQIESNVVATGSGAFDLTGLTFQTGGFAASLINPFIWTWRTALANQNFTLQIGSVGVPAVPDGGSTVSLLGLAALRRKLGC